MKVWLASVDIYGDQAMQVCATEADAMHWLAWESISADDWRDYFNALDKAERGGMTVDRVGMTPEQVLAAWSGTPAHDDTERRWGQGDCFLRVVEMDVYEAP